MSRAMLQLFLEAIQFRISEGFEYLWECYGPTAYGLEYYEPDSENSCTVIFDRQTQEVYQLTATGTGKAYRWINPKYIDRYNAETVKRGLDPAVAWDDVCYSDVDSTAILTVIRETVSNAH